MSDNYYHAIPEKTVEIAVPTPDLNSVHPLGDKALESILHLKAENSNFYVLLGKSGDVFINDNITGSTPGFQTGSASVLFDAILSFFRHAKNEEKGVA